MQTCINRRYCRGSIFFDELQLMTWKETFLFMHVALDSFVIITDVGVTEYEKSVGGEVENINTSYVGTNLEYFRIRLTK